MTTRRHFGSVRKRSSGRWQATYWHDGRLHSAGTFAAKADALAYLSTVEADLHRGAWIDPRAGQVSVRTYANEWLERRPDLSMRTNELYRDLLDRHVLPSLGHATLVGLAPSKIRGWHAGLAQTHASTAAKAYRLLSSIMKTAVLDGLIVASPCKVDGAATEHAAERPIATVGEVEALSAAMPDRLRLLVLLATWTQLRRGELLALRRRDIDPMRSMIHIAQSRTFARDGKSITKAPKTPAGRRSLAAPRSLMTEVESHLDRFVRNDPDALVFTGVTGVPLTAGVLQQAWQRARSRVGREDLHIHDLRHTGLTLAAATGATTAELMHRAGHASPSAALRYQHATEDRDRVLAEALGEFVSPTRITEVELAQDRAE